MSGTDPRPILTDGHHRSQKAAKNVAAHSKRSESSQERQGEEVQGQNQGEKVVIVFLWRGLRWSATGLTAQKST